MKFYLLINKLPDVMPKVAFREFKEAVADSEGNYTLFGKVFSKQQFESIFEKRVNYWDYSDEYFARSEGSNILVELYKEGRLPMKKGKKPSENLAEFALAVEKIKQDEIEYAKRVEESKIAKQKYEERLVYILEDYSRVNESDLLEEKYRQELWYKCKEIVSHESEYGKDRTWTTKRIGNFIVERAEYCPDTKNPRKHLVTYVHEKWVDERSGKEYIFEKQY